MNRISIGLALLALAGGSAYAADRPETKSSSTDNMVSSTSSRPTFDALDVNHDGMISLSEASANVTIKSDFARLDADKDGKLSRAEFAKEASNS